VPNVPSAPSTFNIVLTPVPGVGHQDVTFSPIPSGVISASWHIVGSCTPAPSQTIATSGGANSVSTGNPGGSYDLTIAVTANQLTDIQAAAGGSLAATVTDTLASFATDSITLFELILGVCTYAINPTSVHYDSLSHSGSFALTTTNTCPWTCVSNNPAWLHVTSAASGTGNATCTYTVDANPFPNAARVGTITMGGLIFTVNQDGGISDGVGAQASAALNYALPYPHSNAFQYFVSIGYPRGYLAGVDLDILLGPIGQAFTEVRPRNGAFIGYMNGSKVVVTDRSGVELATGTYVGTVDIWRFRYGG
jgi:hypothetical protein